MPNKIKRETKKSGGTARERKKEERTKPVGGG